MLRTVARTCATMCRRVHSAIVVAFATLFLAVPLHAQRINTLAAGDTIRILTVQDSTIEGIFLAAENSVIRFTPISGPNPIGLEVGTIRQLQVRRPGSRSHNIGSGAVAGMAVGLVATAISAIQTRQNCSRECWAPAMTLIFGVPAATLVGAAFGAGIKVKPHWSTVKLRRDYWP